MIYEIFSSTTSYFLKIFQHLGYLGILIGMALESSIFPLPSEAVLIPAGILIAKSQMSLLNVFIFAIIGSLIGSFFSYFLGFFVGRKIIDSFTLNYGKFIFLSKKNLQKTDNYFKSNGKITVFLGRLIFGVRHLISLISGFGEMNFAEFSLSTLVGASIWNLLLILIGIFLANPQINILVKVISLSLILVAILLLSYLLTRKKN